jgi:hypothetical protein
MWPLAKIIVAVSVLLYGFLALAAGRRYRAGAQSGRATAAQMLFGILSVCTTFAYVTEQPPLVITGLLLLAIVALLVGFKRPRYANRPRV